MKPADDVYRMIYRSEPTAAAAAVLDSVLQQILESSIYNNYSSGLTGLILVAKGYFIQALEGEVNEVRSTYGRISLDRRHKNLCVLSQGEVSERLFGDWVMCYASMTLADKMIVESLVNRPDFDPEKLTSSSAEKLLVAIAYLKRRS